MPCNTAARTRHVSVYERPLELGLDVFTRYLFSGNRPAARSNHRILRGRKDLPCFQLHVVRIPADSLYDCIRDVGYTDSRLAPNG